jgi:Ca2+-binding RTX toxin-like protein
MATLRAFQAFDIRTLVRGDAALGVTADGFVLQSGAWRTTLTGDIQPESTGVQGTVLAYAQTYAGQTVFAATGIERSARTVLEILEARDNDRLLAYTLSGDDLITGSAAADYLIGFGGEDTLRGGSGNDQLFGGSGRDTLDGGLGADFLAGGLDVDLMRGGTGHDTYLVAQAGDRVIEAAAGGYDSILSHVSRTLTAHVERLVLIGTSAIGGRGDGDADVIDGNDAANGLSGEAGNDRLDGDGGADTLDGGAGRDSLTGGWGADTFRFRSAADADGDRILDFAHGQDRIDLAANDADLARPGNQAFRFLGEAALAGRAGDLSARGSFLQGDVDGDGIADFVIRLDGDPALGLADLLL